MTFDPSVPSAVPIAAALAIGCYGWACRDRIGDLLLASARAHPQLDLGVSAMPLREMAAAVRHGSLALAIAPEGGGRGFAVAPLWHDRVMVALAAGHPLATADRITPLELAQEQLLHARDAVDDERHRFLLSRLPGASLRVTALDGDAARVANMVAAGEGVALTCAGQLDGFGCGTVLRPVADDRARFAVNAYWRTPAAGAALSALVADWGGAPPVPGIA